MDLQPQPGSTPYGTHQKIGIPGLKVSVEQQMFIFSCCKQQRTFINRFSGGLPADCGCKCRNGKITILQIFN